MDLLTIMECYFQRSISQAIKVAVIVQVVDTGESESSCVYYYLFLFSGWWFDYCTYAALNGKYNPSSDNYNFLWFSKTTGYILPNRSEMKIRRQ